MKYAFTISALVAVASANPQGYGGPGHGGPPDFQAGLPSCVTSCFTSQSGCNSGDFSCYCNSTSISSLNSCISGSSCSTSDKEGAYQSIAQFCADSGASVTATPEATFSATSGGTSWPTQWTSNSAYAAALSSWKTQTTGAPGPLGAWGPGSTGWSAGGGYGPFGQGQGQSGNGWGPWASDHSGSWTTGPWTQWWGTGACPASTWSGWTSGSWDSAPAWTSWSGCIASTTATSVITTTVTSAGKTTAITTTSFAVKVDQASATATTGGAPSNYGVIGAAAGVAGVFAGAVLL